jgi:hypothetical protein
MPVEHPVRNARRCSGFFHGEISHADKGVSPERIFQKKWKNFADIFAGMVGSLPNQGFSSEKRGNATFHCEKFDSL